MYTSVLKKDIFRRKITFCLCNSSSFISQDFIIIFNLIDFNRKEYLFSEKMIFNLLVVFASISAILADSTTLTSVSNPGAVTIAANTIAHGFEAIPFDAAIASNAATASSSAVEAGVAPTFTTARKLRDAIRRDAVASADANGRKLIANFATATNFGTRQFFACASTANGAVVGCVVYAGLIYVSSNYGQTVTSPTSPALAQSYENIAMSSTGQYMTVVVYGGSIWVSSNTGASFSSITAITGVTGALVDNLHGISMSQNGRYQFVSLFYPYPN